MVTQNSYIFLESPYKKTKKKEHTDGTIVLPVKLNIYHYIKNIFKITNDEKIGIHKHRYGCVIKKDKYKCDVVFTETEVANIHYLDVSVNGRNKLQIINCLEDVHNKLLNSGVRENYIDIVSFDCISEYYCNKIFSKLNAFERNLRKLLFNIYILNFGKEYYQATMNDDLQSKIKGLINSSCSKEKKAEIKKQYNVSGSEAEDIARLQQFFYSFEYADIQKFLFNASWTGFDKQKQIEFLEKNENLSELSDEKLRKAFSNFSPKSDWERFFSKKINIPDIEEVIEQIRIFRNNVAHCKFFYKDDYELCDKLISKLNVAVLNAIKITEEIDFAAKNWDNLKIVISNFSERMKELMNPILEAQMALFKSGIFDIMTNRIGDVISSFLNNLDEHKNTDDDNEIIGESEDENNG